ncbi:TRAP-type C4-dicarboxylate transport system permease small subunit [Labrenzia sp. EL_13]|nr:TRAP-type C4-dicarboxylate transport system permease small subunit [Labrenzia sp. EL_195]MBG6199128.1 TRAP-type C4-dicarboxylate transport system permease small subunit [Labrenzia sp. EL_13]
MAQERTGGARVGTTGVIRQISEVSGWIAATMILGAVFLTCQMIFIRFVLNGSTVWQTEIVVYLVVAATLLGLPFVQKHKGHVNVDLLPMWLGPKGAKLLSVATTFSSLCIIGVCSFYGYEYWHLALTRGWTSDTVTAVPLWIPYLALPVGFGLLFLQLASDCADTFFNLSEKSNGAV